MRVIRLAVAVLLLATVFQVLPAAQAAECTEGAYMTQLAGPYCSCDDGMRTPKDRYKCIGGVWEYQSSFCGAPFCQGY